MLEPGDLDVLRRMLVRLRRKEFKFGRKARESVHPKCEMFLSEERANSIRAAALERALAQLQAPER